MKRFFSNPWTILAVATLLVAAFVGCNRPVEQAPVTTPEPEPVAEPEDPVDLAWTDMNFEQRAGLMREQVMPAMTPLFQQWEPEDFANFTCAACHGENFQEVTFHMPNGLHPMSVDEIMAMADSRDDDTVAAFLMMSQQVVPGMAGILGTQPFDPATGQGFGCFHCHENSGAASKP